MSLFYVPKNLIYMENKLTWVELKKAVAHQTQLTEKEVNHILTIWLEEMVSALQRGEELHINGLGTFKMKTMKARKSVDVTTGEAIILPETERLTYTMASSLEELLRDDAPTHLTVGTNPIQKLSDQADEILDILGEMGQGQKAKKQEGEKAKGREGKPMKPKRIEIPDYQIPVQPQPQPQPQQPKKERMWLTALITIVAFVGLLFGLFYFFQHKFEQWLKDLRTEAEMVEMVETTSNLEDLENIDTLESLESLDNPETPKVTNHRVYTNFITTEEMHQDSRLAWMAYRYYGNKKLWVFIYDANRDHITNPEHIAVGTPIRVPQLSQEILNYGEDIQTLVQQMYDEFIHK